MKQIVSCFVPDTGASRGGGGRQEGRAGFLGNNPPLEIIDPPVDGS